MNDSGKGTDSALPSETGKNGLFKTLRPEQIRTKLMRPVLVYLVEMIGWGGQKTPFFNF